MHNDHSDETVSIVTDLLYAAVELEKGLRNDGYFSEKGAEPDRQTCR